MKKESPRNDRIRWAKRRSTEYLQSVVDEHIANQTKAKLGLYAPVISAPELQRFTAAATELDDRRNHKALDQEAANNRP